MTRLTENFAASTKQCLKSILRLLVSLSQPGRTVGEGAGSAAWPGVGILGGYLLVQRSD